MLSNIDEIVKCASSRCRKIDPTTGQCVLKLNEIKNEEKADDPQPLSIL